MPVFGLNSLLLIASSFQAALGAVIGHVARDGSSPSLESDPNTTSYCTWWVDLGSAKSCPDLLSENFMTWKRSGDGTQPSLLAATICSLGTRTVSTTTSTATIRPSTTTTAPPTATTTKPSNGITTPLPTQSNLVDNYNSFYFVKSGNSQPPSPAPTASSRRSYRHRIPQPARLAPDSGPMRTPASLSLASTWHLRRLPRNPATALPRPRRPSQA
ncbi:hypothetical protein JX266_012049 [Neoarthrinium moseri]|nr:hypothetical protein JX266_012049 [Neoarthrinium moseri]